MNHLGGGAEPRTLKSVLAELIAVRGFARRQAGDQLTAIWHSVAGDEFARQTRVAGIQRGQLRILVSNSALLAELNSFHREEFLSRLQSEHADLKIREIRFRLQGKLENRAKSQQE